MAGMMESDASKTVTVGFISAWSPRWSRKCSTATTHAVCATAPLGGPVNSLFLMMDALAADASIGTTKYTIVRCSMMVPIPS